MRRGIEDRKHPRSRVHVRVSYNLVETFAENLSAGGLFIRDAGLAPKQKIALEIELPRLGTFRVSAQVAHVGDIGAGLQLLEPPKAFVDALAKYLARLARRADAKVFVDVDPWKQLITDAGYQVLALPPPHELVQWLGDATAVGLLAPRDTAAQYKSALAFLGDDGSLVIEIHPKHPVEPVLAWLDDKLLAGNS